MEQQAFDADAIKSESNEVYHGQKLTTNNEFFI